MGCTAHVSPTHTLLFITIPCNVGYIAPRANLQRFRTLTAAGFSRRPALPAANSICWVSWSEGERRGGVAMSSGSGDAQPTLEPPYSEVEVWLRAVHSVVAVVLMVASLAGNCLVLWVVIRNKELQYRSILASMGAVAVNIAFAVFTGPQVVAGSVTGEWPFTEDGCVAVGFVTNGIFYVRWMNTLLIAIDRLLYIVTPFWYERNSKAVLILLTVLVWTIPFISNAPSAIYRSYSYRSTFTLCAINCENDNACYSTYILLFAAYMIIGMLLPIIIYTFLYCYGKKKRREMNRELGTQGETPTAGNAPATNGRLPSEHYLSARRPSTDLVSIHEEDEETETEMGPTGHQESHTHQHITSLELGTIHEHQEEISIAQLQNGRHIQSDTCSTASDPTPHTGAARDSREDHAHLDKAEPADSAGSIHHKRQLGHRRGSSESGTGSTSSYQRRTSLVVLSRAALSAFIPNRQQMATHRRERRATVTFAIIFSNLVLTQILLFILSALRRQDYYSSIPIWVHMVAVNLFLLAPVLDPVIIMKNQDFKRALVRIFCRRRSSFSLSHSVVTR